MSLKDLANELEPLRFRWREVGAQFGFTVNDLDEIEEKDPHGGAQQWMTTMLDRKLRTTPGFGWDDVLEARKRIEYEALARQLGFPRG